MWFYVVYRNPSDYPGLYVVRRHWVHSGGPIAEAAPLIVTQSLDSARAVIPADLYNIGRYPEDDPAILEVWV
jgi:hypothetical protein